MNKLFIFVFLLLNMPMFVGCSSISEDKFNLANWERLKFEADELTANQVFDEAEIKYLASRQAYFGQYEFSATFLYRELSWIYFAQGKYKKASELHWAIVREGESWKREKELHYFILDCLELSKCLVAEGNLVEASKILSYSSDLTKQFVQREPHNSGFEKNLTYRYLGDFYVQKADYDAAKRFYRDALENAKRSPLPSHDIARAQMNLAYACLTSGDNTEAEELLRQILDNNARVVVPFAEDKAKALSYLAQLDFRKGNPQDAIEHCEDAVTVLQSDSFGVMKTQEADVWLLLGKINLALHKTDDAKAAFEKVISLRDATGTMTHPSCAEALIGLASISALDRKYDIAMSDLEKAITILDSAVISSHPRRQPALIALYSLCILSNNPDRSSSSLNMISDILKNPLGPWKEGILKTTAFYAGLLRDAGKTSEADRLAQLHTQQMNKP